MRNVFRWVIIQFFLFSFTELFSFQADLTYSKGPLYGKNIYSPFLIFLHTPGTPAAIKQSGRLTTYINLYYTQAFSIYKIDTDREGNITKVFPLNDYESFVFETGISYALTKNLEISTTMRIISYYGGFMDAPTEWWHHLLRVPNGGRELVPQNQVMIDFRTNNGFDISLDAASVGFGDIDLWLKYLIYSNRYVDFAFQGGFKIPTGQLRTVTGSNYPDIGCALLVDIYPIRYLSLFFQAGAIVPFHSFIPAEAKPYPMFNGLAAIELSPLKWFSLVIQMNFRTSPITGNYYFVNNLNIRANHLGSVQTNLLVGFLFQVKNFRIQLYFEEDTFTNAGADYTLALSLATNIRTR